MNGVVLFYTVFTAHEPVLGITLQCRHCDSVRGPTECRNFQHCQQHCATTVQDIGGEYMFSYNCGHHQDCSKDAHHHLHHDKGPVVCQECCHSTGCDQNACSQYFNTTNTATTAQIPTAATTTTKPTTTTRIKGTTKAPLDSKGCNNMDVLSGLVTGSSVSHPGTQVCPDGVHQPSEALVQEYCALALTNWIPGEKVMENCPRVPSYTAVAAITPVFGGATIAGVFIKCEIGGFQAAIQTCGSQLRIHHVSTNSTTDISQVLISLF
ncbi:uncharacterized protein LOC123549983 isoform X2 [Mercenaria mercenaria]|uniref:uncharacterized protein LOC123549983 isoform X2 n=1 Tax=Mercenaria mercenaria TaxID=6596 RepID=UPI00234E7EAD|nr:uncharacterized protein LOC123549983 isoform X2 [Mercenaria mercenaria]